MKYVMKISNIYYYCLIAWIFCNLILHSGFSNFGGFVASAYAIVKFAALGLLFLVYIYVSVKRNIQIKDFFLALLLVAIALASYYFSGRDDLFMLICFVVCSINIDFDKCARYIFRTQLIAITFIALCALLGIIDNEVLYTTRNGVLLTRYSMGFSHPNIFAALILQLEALVLYLHFKKIKILHFLIVFVISFGVYKITFSRTSFYLMCLLLIVTFIYRYSDAFRLRKLWGWTIKNGAKLLVIFGIVASILITINLNNIADNSFLSIDTIQSRIYLLRRAFQVYPVTPFGQEVSIISSSEYSSLTAGNSVVVDNAYIYSLLQYGFVNTAVLLFLYIISIHKEGKKNNVMFCICAIIFIMLGFTEKYFVNPMYNFSLFVLMRYIYHRPSHYPITEGLNKRKLSNREII